MISPELLRRFPIFVGFTESQLKALAIIAEETELAAHTIMFEEGAPAQNFYLLVKGSIDLYMKSEEENNPASRRDFTVGEINPGEIFGLSTILNPTAYELTGRCAEDSIVLSFDGIALRQLIDEDIHFAYQTMRMIAFALKQRLYSARVQLAAAWA